MNSGVQLFSDKDQASAYAKYRPTYPDELYTAIYDYAGPPQMGVALDVATGNGQAARALAQRYQTVHAQDPSAEQIAAAPAVDGVRFEVAPAESNGLPDGSVDLVTVAQAMHWFDIPVFYQEAARVLRSAGAIAIWTYDLGTFVGEPEATAALEKLFEEQLGEYWDPRMRVAMANKYEGQEPQLPLFSDVTRHTFTMRSKLTIDQVLGWIRSWSGYANWKAATAPGPDPLMLFHGDLKDALEFKSHSAEVTVEFRLHLVLARRA